MENEANGLQRKIEKPICDLQTQTAHMLKSFENAMRGLRRLAKRYD